MVLEQTCAAYFKRQNMKPKRQFLNFFAKLWELVQFSDIIDEQLWTFSV